MGSVAAAGASVEAADVSGTSAESKASSIVSAKSEDIMPLKERLEMLLKHRTSSNSNLGKEHIAEPGRLQGADQDSKPLGLAQVVQLLQASVANAASGDACHSAPAASGTSPTAEAGQSDGSGSGAQDGESGSAKGKVLQSPKHQSHRQGQQPARVRVRAKRHQRRLPKLHRKREQKPSPEVLGQGPHGKPR